MEETKLSLLRQYFTEIVVAGLVAAVITLFWLYIDLSTYMRDQLTNTLHQNKTTLEETTKLLREISTSLKSIEK